MAYCGIDGVSWVPSLPRAECTGSGSCPAYSFSPTFAPSNEVHLSNISCLHIWGDDLDGNGNIDIIAATHAGLYWWANGPQGGTFSSARQLLPETIHSVQTADVDQDGLVDIIASVSGYKGITLLRQLRPTAPGLLRFAPPVVVLNGHAVSHVRVGKGTVPTLRSVDGSLYLVCAS